MTSIQRVCWIGILLVLLVITGRGVAALPQTLDIVSLAHPILHSETEVAERLQLCLSILQAPPESIPVSQQSSVRQLAEFFLLFAGDPNQPLPSNPNMTIAGRPLYLDLHEMPHPVVTAVTQKLNLPVPEGFVFLRFYPSIWHMPPPVRAAFDRHPHTRAVTFLSRYVALLEDPGVAAPEELAQKRLNETLGHELVHVTLNATLETAASQLPRWFHEGCAITFSGRQGSQAVAALTDTPTGLQFVTYQFNLPDDYESYALVFKYLQQRFGKSSFYQCLHDAIGQRSVQTLMQKAGAVDFAGLHQQARRWQQRREAFLWLSGSAFLMFLTWRIWRRLSREPQRPQEVV